MDFVFVVQYLACQPRHRATRFVEPRRMGIRLGVVDRQSIYAIG